MTSSWLGINNYSIYSVDIPLNPSATSPFDNGFVVHWLNNKELQFTIESEKLMNDINTRATCTEDQFHEDMESVSTETSHPGRFPSRFKISTARHISLLCFSMSATKKIK